MHGADAQDHASSVPTLAELISTRKAERGWSYAELAHRAGDALSPQRWQQLGTGVRIKEFPEPATLRAMAEALDIDVSIVVLAAAKSTGLDVRNDLSILAQQLPASAARLEPDARNAIVALVRAITKETTNDQEEQEPRPQASSEEHGGTTGPNRSRSGAPMKRRKVTALKPADQDQNVDETGAQSSESNPSSGRNPSGHGDDAPPFDPSKVLAAKRGKKSDTK